MLEVTLKYRKGKEDGDTQEELSCMLHVVRKMLSKWGNDVSVRASEILIRISEALETCL